MENTNNLIIDNKDHIRDTTEKLIEHFKNSRDSLEGMTEKLIRLLKENRDGLEDMTAKFIDHLFKSPIPIKVDEKKKKINYPSLIALDIEGCITPPKRTEIDLLKFQRLRWYCEYVKKNPKYPQIIIFTGRSQGYVELLAQCLNIMDSIYDIPFVIENGAALYWVTEKKTERLIKDVHQEIIYEIYKYLTKEFKLPNTTNEYKYEFEPKVYMITINPNEGQSTEALRDEIKRLLSKKPFKESNYSTYVEVTSTASAVDITPEGFTKLTGLKAALNKIKEKYPEYGRRIVPESIVAVGDSLSDFDVLKEVGTAYCSSQDANTEVKDWVKSRFGKSHTMSEQHIDLVTAVIEEECGLKILNTRPKTTKSE